MRRCKVYIPPFAEVLTYPYFSQKRKEITIRKILVFCDTRIGRLHENLKIHRDSAIHGWRRGSEYTDVYKRQDVNTTRKHYAAMKDENKRKAAKAVRLRED